MTAVYELDNPIVLSAGLSAKPSDGLEPSTPSLPWGFWERYARRRAVTRERVCPANRAFTLREKYPGVPARAQEDVPVSYPRRVVCSQISIQARVFWVSSLTA